ncbi:hypothetical protein ACFL54_03965, partial [Planctomycetota bacterium]
MQRNNCLMAERGGNRGIVLLMVVGVLALLSVLAVTFVSMTRLERSISRNYVAHTRAVLCAESGIDYAIARINGFQGGVLRADSENNEMELMRYEEDPGKPGLEFAVKPSFNVINPDGSQDDISGVVSSTYLENSDVFKLHVQDESGKLNINDSNGKWNMDTDPDPDSDDIAVDSDMAYAFPRLGKIFEYLVERLFGDPANPRGIGADAALRLFEGREKVSGKKFSSWRQVRDVLVNPGNPNAEDPLTSAQFRELQKHITLWSWQDPDVIKPNYKLSITDPDPDYSYPQRGFDVYIFRDFQNKSFELEPRCPVNINTASPELIESLLAGISGWFLREGPGETVSTARYGTYGMAALEFTRMDEKTIGCPCIPGYGCPFGKNNITGMARQSPPVRDPVGLAQALWQRIHDQANPDPIETWEEFDYCLRAEEDPGSSGAPWAMQYILPDNEYSDYFDDDAEGRGELIGGTPAFNAYDHFLYDETSAKKAWWIDYMFNIQVDALLANFNPNSQLNQYTPNKVVYRRVDKSHLTSYTTEFCFEPTGYFQIESLGLIRDRNAGPVAKYNINSVVKLFYLLRHTSQAQFMAGVNTVDSLDNTGGGPFQECASFPTAGAGIFSPNGFTLQSYPEPLRAPRQPGVPEFAFSPFDGSLMLATWQEDKSGLGAVFHHHFNGSIYPTSSYTVGGADEIYLTASPGTAEDLFPGDRNIPTESILTNAKESPWYPGNLYPDGAYSEAGRTLTFKNINVGSNGGQAGTLEFWIKPNYHTGITSRVHRQVNLLHGYSSFIGTYVKEFSAYYFCHSNTDNEVPKGYSGDLFSNNWIATRSLEVGWGGFRKIAGWDHNVSANYSPTMCHDFPGHGSSPDCQDLGNYEGHCWNHICLRWDTGLAQTYRPSLVTNGDGPYVESSLFHSEKAEFINLHEQGGVNSYIRLGSTSVSAINIQDFIDGIIPWEWFMDWAWSPRQAFSADATFDDVVGYEEFVGQPAGGADPLAEFLRGRYVNTDSADAHYTSKGINLLKEFKLNPREHLKLRSISWTAWWPKYNREVGSNRIAANFPGLDVNNTPVYANDPMGGIWNNNDLDSEAWDP